MGRSKCVPAVRGDEGDPPRFDIQGIGGELINTSVRFVYPERLDRQHTTDQWSEPGRADRGREHGWCAIRQDPTRNASARSVSALTAVCDALAVLAVQNSPLLPRYAAVAKDVCKACEDEWLKHAEKHAPCKACADACADCARECANIAP